MFLLNHFALLLLAFADKRSGEDSMSIEKKLIDAFPYLAMPDALGNFTGEAVSHFRKTADETDVSWIQYPALDKLSRLNSITINDAVRNHRASKPHFLFDVAFDGEISLKAFLSHNYWHPGCQYIYIHLLQDGMYEEFVKQELVDVAGRFSNRYVLRNNRTVTVTVDKIKEQLKLLDEIGFYILAGHVYHKTGILMTQDWFDDKLLKKSLVYKYPSSLQDYVWQHTRIPEYVEKQLKNHKFYLNGMGNVKNLILIEESKVEETIDEMFSWIFRYICQSV